MSFGKNEAAVVANEAPQVYDGLEYLSFGVEEDFGVVISKVFVQDKWCGVLGVENVFIVCGLLFASEGV